jgi:hypothetical protein
MTRCLWPLGPKDKMLFRPMPQLPPQRARLRLARALRQWVCPARGGASSAQASKKRKRQVSTRR